MPSVFINLSTDNMQFDHELKENNDSGCINVYDENVKKSYSITLGTNTSLLQGIIDDKWNLIGNGYDPTLLENVMIYDMAEGVGLSYSPKVQNVELYLEGEYVGVYLITNEIKIAQSNVNIKNLEKVEYITII